ncbi:MAG: hypothetical protein WA113_00970 [Desulfitobacteriaceae bacterium]
MKKILTVFLIIILTTALYGCTQNKDQSATAHAMPVDPNSLPFDFAKSALTKENIVKALAKVLPEGQITNVTIESNIVTIRYNPGAQWDEKSLVRNSAVKDVKVFAILHSNPKIEKAALWTQNPITDIKDNKNVEDVMMVTFLRASEKDINWSNFEDLVVEDYNKLLNIADDKYIHPEIAKALE